LLELLSLLRCQHGDYSVMTLPLDLPNAFRPLLSGKVRIGAGSLHALLCLLAYAGYLSLLLHAELQIAYTSALHLAALHPLLLTTAHALSAALCPGIRRESQRE
jgi:hypothetical protein